MPKAWPCQTMAMWPNVILVLDTQDKVVVWIGREVAYWLMRPEERVKGEGSAGEDWGWEKRDETVVV